MASEGWQGCRTNYFFVNEQSLQASSYASATREIKTLRIRRIAGGGGATSKEGCGSGNFKVVEVNLPATKLLMTSREKRRARPLAPALGTQGASARQLDVRGGCKGRLAYLYEVVSLFISPWEMGLLGDSCGWR